MDYFYGRLFQVRSSSSVRKPALAHSEISGDKDNQLSIGAVMRKAKRELFLRRVVYGILLVLLLTLIAYVITLGYAEDIVDRFFSLMG